MTGNKLLYFLPCPLPGFIVDFLIWVSPLTEKPVIRSLLWFMFIPIDRIKNNNT